jgi:regulator of replication initiation timing
VAGAVLAALLAATPAMGQSSEVQRLRAELAATQNRMHQMEAEARKLAAMTEALRAELAMCRNVIAKLQAENAELRQRLMQTAAERAQRTRQGPVEAQEAKSRAKREAAVKTVVDGDVVFSVTGCEYNAGVDRGPEPTRAGRRVTIRYTVRNAAPENQLTFRPPAPSADDADSGALPMLTDGGGRSWPLVRAEGKASGRSVRLQPGRSWSGALIFEAPAGGGTRELALSFPRSAWGESGQLGLLLPSPSEP